MLSFQKDIEFFLCAMKLSWKILSSFLKICLAAISVNTQLTWGFKRTKENSGKEVTKSMCEEDQSSVMKALLLYILLKCPTFPFVKKYLVLDSCWAGAT